MVFVLSIRLRNDNKTITFFRANGVHTTHEHKRNCELNIKHCYIFVGISTIINVIYVRHKSHVSLLILRLRASHWTWTMSEHILNTHECDTSNVAHTDCRLPEWNSSSSPRQCSVYFIWGKLSAFSPSRQSPYTIRTFQTRFIFAIRSRHFCGKAGFFIHFKNEFRARAPCDLWEPSREYNKNKKFCWFSRSLFRHLTKWHTLRAECCVPRMSEIIDSVLRFAIYCVCVWCWWIMNAPSPSHTLHTRTTASNEQNCFGV